MRLDPEVIRVDSFTTTPGTGDQAMVTPLLPITIGVRIALCDDRVNP